MHEFFVGEILLGVDSNLDKARSLLGTRRRQLAQTTDRRVEFTGNNKWKGQALYGRVEYTGNNL